MAKKKAGKLRGPGRPPSESPLRNVVCVRVDDPTLAALLRKYGQATDTGPGEALRRLLRKEGLLK